MTPLPYVLSAATLDDLMRKALKKLVDTGERTDPSQGVAFEHRGVSLVLTNPLARLSRSQTRGKLFSALGELIWYLGGSDDPAQISYYLPAYEHLVEDGRLWGAYGPRLFDLQGHDQIAGVIDRLRSKPDSRRAVVQIFDHLDVAGDHKDVPCTTSLQFFVREGRVELIVTMRSNDAYIGLPHDVFAFTMLQEIVARSLGLELGRYVHVAGSLHFYEKNMEAVLQFLEEGWHTTDVFMPPMPDGDPVGGIQELISVEQQLRENPTENQFDEMLQPGYWQDLGRLLLALTLARQSNWAILSELRQHMTHQAAFDIYLRERQDGEVWA